MDLTSEIQVNNVFISIHFDFRNDSGDSDYKIAQKQPGERLRGREKKPHLDNN